MIAERAGCVNSTLHQESEVAIGESLWCLSYMSRRISQISVSCHICLDELLGSAGQWDVEVVEELAAEVFRYLPFYTLEISLHEPYPWSHHGSSPQALRSPDDLLQVF